MYRIGGRQCYLNLGGGGHTQSFHVFPLLVSSKAHWLSAFVCFVSSDPSQWTKEPTMQCLAVPESLNHDNTKGHLLFWLYKTMPRSCFRKAGAEVDLVFTLWDISRATKVCFAHYIFPAMYLKLMISALALFISATSKHVSLGQTCVRKIYLSSQPKASHL